MKKFVFPLILLMALVLAACSTGGQNPEPEVTTLIYANLTEGGVDRQAIDFFNARHKDVKIEVRDYFDEDGLSGKQKLLSEIGAGKIPDIIDLNGKTSVESNLPYKALARKGVLEDLWPYIENDPDLGRESLWEAPLKTAEVDGGLYVAFGHMAVTTLTGRESVVGDRYSWTLDELLETFATMPEDSTIVEYYATKDSMFYILFNFNLEQYVDWETGKCTFDSDNFRTQLEFVNSFPSEFNVDAHGGEDAINDELQDRVRHGKQMLDISWIYTPQEIQYLDTYFALNEKAAFVGYPTSDGSIGSSFVTYGSMLGMSSVCQDKDAAWEFIRQIFLPQYKDDDAFKNAMIARSVKQGCPVNLSDYDRLIRYQTGKMRGVTFSKDPGKFPQETTAEQVERFEDLVNHVDKIALGDSEIYKIVYENATAYFAGDKTLDETVELIQRRVSLYVNEMR